MFPLSARLEPSRDSVFVPGTADFWTAALPTPTPPSTVKTDTEQLMVPVTVPDVLLGICINLLGLP